MSTAEHLAALTAGLVDDAAVFPPGNASVPDAVDAHLARRTAWYAPVVGPLLVRASQATDLLREVARGDDLAVGLVADTGLVGLAEATALLVDQDDAARVVQVEIALPAGHPPGAAVRAVLEQLAFSATTYVEIPRVPGWEDALDVLAEDGAERAKLRTGGETAASHPSEQELAAFLRACLDRRLSFKLTAGLHHALRATSPEGYEQHGFLNVLAAVAAGLDAAGVDELAAVLGERRPEPVLERLLAAPAAPVRERFVSFGCCGVLDPVDDLVALGLLGED